MFRGAGRLPQCLSETGNLPLEFSKVSWREGQEPNDSECRRTLENGSESVFFGEFC